MPESRVHPPAGVDWAEPGTSSRIVVVAASAGGLTPLLQLLSSLPADLPAAVVVVQHRGPEYPEILPSLVSTRTALEVRQLTATEPLVAGTVYICPPGMHVTTEYALRVVEGPRLEFVRPSADLALRSAARTPGPGTIAVVLSGMGSDGAAGCESVAAAGGAVLVQEPSSCLHAGMPDAVLRRGVGGQALSVEDIAAEIVRRVTGGSEKPVVPTASTRVLLADDHRILRDGLRTLLGAEPDIDVVAEAADGREAVRLACTLFPDVVVMDIGMPHLDGIEATRRLRALQPRIRVVALSAFLDGDMAERAFRAGAFAYLDKNAAFSELAGAIRAVARGGRYLSPRIPALS